MAAPVSGLDALKQTIADARQTLTLAEEEVVETGAEETAEETTETGETTATTETTGETTETETAEETATGETAATPDELTVEIPGRRPGDPPLQVVAPDKEAADLMRQNVNNGMRREEFNRRVEAVERQRGELEYIETWIQTDPVGFVLENMHERFFEDMAETILAHPGVLEKLAPKLGLWQESPDARRADLAERKNKAAETQTSVQRTFQNREAGRTITRTTELVVDELAGVLQDPAQRALFENDALRDVADYLRAAKTAGRRVGNLAATDIVTILEQRLRIFGLDPAQAKAVFDPQNPQPVSRLRPVGAAATRVAQGAADKARSAGKQFTRASEARRTAAATPAGGAGGVTTGAPTPPAGPKTIKERVAWAKQHLLKR